MDERLEIFLNRFESKKKALLRYASDLAAEQMGWVPAGIDNSMAWIVRHWADLCWLAYGGVSGRKVPARPAARGLPQGIVESVRWQEDAGEPPATAAALSAALETAWGTLREYLIETYPTWIAATYALGDNTYSAWWLLELCLVDAAHHEGQADYLRRIMPDAAQLESSLVHPESASS